MANNVIERLPFHFIPHSIPFYYILFQSPEQVYKIMYDKTLTTVLVLFYCIAMTDPVKLLVVPSLL